MPGYVSMSPLHSILCSHTLYTAKALLAHIWDHKLSAYPCVYFLLIPPVCSLALPLLLGHFQWFSSFWSTIHIKIIQYSPLLALYMCSYAACHFTSADLDYFYTNIISNSIMLLIPISSGCRLLIRDYKHPLYL